MNERDGGIRKTNRITHLRYCQNRSDLLKRGPSPDIRYLEEVHDWTLQRMYIETISVFNTSRLILGKYTCSSTIIFQIDIYI